MNRCLAIAVLVAQMTAGVCVLMVSGSKGAECARCCEGMMAGKGAMLGACCRIASPTLPALEASSPFTVTAPVGPTLNVSLTTAAPSTGRDCAFSFGKYFCDTSPPRLYLRNSAFLI